MLDLCSGDSFVLKYVGEYLTDYIGVDNNEKYLKSLKSEWPDFKFINTDISKLDELREIKDFKPNLIFMNGAIHHLNDETMKLINDFNYKFKNSIFLSVDPVKHDNGLINKIMIFFDRGKYIRNRNGFHKIMPTYKQFIIDDFYQMSFQNIFHYNNINIPELYNNWKNLIK
jgi:hypothetical protein